MWPFKKTQEAREKQFASKVVEFIGWRNNMWVMTPDGVGVLFQLGTECTVHIVDELGLTVASNVYPILALRQAKFLEIPKARRGFDKQTAANMGYF